MLWNVEEFIPRSLLATFFRIAFFPWASKTSLCFVDRNTPSPDGVIACGYISLTGTAKQHILVSLNLIPSPNGDRHLVHGLKACKKMIGGLLG